MTVMHPKLFISYSWTSPEHEEWVLSLAHELVDNGVDVKLDKWDLKEGQDAYAFMESMVTDPEITKVIMVCDRCYVAKANDRSGGVGTETQIISAEVYSKRDQTKFVAILPEKDEGGQPYLPIYYKSRIYIDLSDDYNKNFEQLLRWIYDKPLHEKPTLGKRPAFLDDNAAIRLPTQTIFRRLKMAIHEGKPNCGGVLREYIEVFTCSLEQFRIADDTGIFDEHVLKSIELFRPYRDEVIELCMALARYRAIQDSWDALHGFLEKVLPYTERPAHVHQWKTTDFDNFKFIAYELFLYVIAVLLQRECFAGVAHLLKKRYYFALDTNQQQTGMIPFTAFQSSLQSLETRNERLGSRRISPGADLLKQRIAGTGMHFRQLMQADFVLFLRTQLDDKGIHWTAWWPMTSIYVSEQYGPFEVFARSQSAAYFDNLKLVFDIEDKEAFIPLKEAVDKKVRGMAHHHWFPRDSPWDWLGFDELATRP